MPTRATAVFTIPRVARRKTVDRWPPLLLAVIVKEVSVPIRAIARDDTSFEPRGEKMVTMIIPISELVISATMVLSIAFLTAAGCFLIAGGISAPRASAPRTAKR